MANLIYIRNQKIRIEFRCSKCYNYIEIPYKIDDFCDNMNKDGSIILYLTNKKTKDILENEYGWEKERNGWICDECIEKCR